MLRPPTPTPTPTPTSLPPITIPVYTYLISLSIQANSTQARIGSTRAPATASSPARIIPSNWNAGEVSAVFNRVNTIWQPANICFENNIRPQQAPIQLPGTTRQGEEGADYVSPEGAFFIYSAIHHTGGGIVLLLVPRISNPIAIGERVSSPNIQNLAVLPSHPVTEYAATALAHEFGHILGLPHIHDGSAMSGMSAERQSALSSNLMFNSIGGSLLTQEQVTRARSANIAVTFTPRSSVAGSSSTTTINR